MPPRSGPRLAAAALALAAAAAPIACRARASGGEAVGHAAPPAAAKPPPATLAPHPRLFLTPDALRRLKAKAAARDPDWQNVLRQADRLQAMSIATYDRNATPPDAIAYAYQGGGWLDAVTALGLAYNVTGAKKYARKVADLLREINATAAAGNLQPIQVDSGFPSRSAAFAAALAFDWIYRELSAGERAATVATLDRWFDVSAKTAYDRDGPATSNYFGGHLLGWGAAGYATAGDNPRAAEIIEHVRRRFDEVVRPAFARGAFAGGYPPEGYVYGTNHYYRLLEYMTMVGGATGTPIPGTIAYAEKIARNLLHALKPNGWQVPDEADYPGDTAGVLNLGLPVLLSHLLEGRPLGAAVQHLVANVGAPPRGVTIERPSNDFLLYWDGRRPAKSRAATEPLVLHSAGDEHLFMRSSWSKDAVWASFSGGLVQAAGHQARAAGHLAIQRGNDPLLVYAGQLKGENGVFGRPQQFQTTSAYANTLFVDDGGEYLYHADAYLGGQGPFAEPRLLAFTRSADATWAKLDATAAYDLKPENRNDAQRSLRQFVRNFAYLAPATFVLFDRVRMLKPSYAIEIRFHFPGRHPPTVSDRLATAVVGSSALHIRALLPESPAMRVAWDTVGGVNLNPRLSVAAGAPGTSLDVLTVLAAGDRRAPAPEAALVKADTGVMLGAHVKASRPGDPDEVALFAAAVSGALPADTVVRYRVAPAGRSRHHLFDLAPGRTFRVRAASVAGVPGAIDVAVAPDGPGAALISDASGALAFDIVAGEVRPAPPAAP